MRRPLGARSRRGRGIRRGSLSALVAKSLAAGVAALAAAAPEAGAATGSTVLFRDDFDGRRLAPERWNTCYWWASTGCTNYGTHERQWYLPGQVRLRSGVLNLVAERRSVLASDGRTYPYVSGMVSSGPPYESTRSKFAFRYGRAVIRARTPAGRGLWPAFWLLAANRTPIPEIDILEIFGDRPATALMFLHYRDRNGRKARRGGRWTSPALRSGWHRYAVDWRPGKLVWRIDGVPRFRVLGDPVPDQRMYLILNLAVGGDGPGPPAPSTPFPSRFAIDYVEVRR
jgi:beta-glucanase (GH16 family)